MSHIPSSVLLEHLVLAALAGAAIARLTTREAGPYGIFFKWQKWVQAGASSANALRKEFSYMAGCMYCLAVWSSIICFVLSFVPWVGYGVAAIGAFGGAWALLGLMGAYAATLRD